MSLSYSSRGLKRLYDRLPAGVQDVAASIYGYRQRARIYGDGYHKAYATIIDSQWWSESRVTAYRDEACNRFLKSAVAESSYWRGLAADLGLTVNTLSVETLAQLPILSKQQVREAGNDLLAGPWASGARRGVSVHTSGTTGMGLHLVLSRECWQREYAFRDLHRAWGGIRPGDTTATLAGHPVVPIERERPPFWRHNAAFNQTVFSSQHITEASLAFYVRELVRLAPRLLHGYPSSVYVIASYCLEIGEDRIRPAAVYCHSETLFDWQRATIERAFGCKVFNWYGNTEMTVNIVECERGTMHVKNEHSLVEFLRADGSAARPGEYARIVTTGFGNAATPLIRYDTGDMAVLREGTCECGRPGPLVEAILGRQEDVFVTPDGRMVGRLDHAFKDAINVVEAQLVQDEPGAVEVRVVRRPEYTTEDERMIERELRARLGSRVAFHFIYMDRIPRQANGKFRFAVSRVPLPFRRDL